MPKEEEITRAISGLEEVHKKLTVYRNLDTNEAGSTEVVLSRDIEMSSIKREDILQAVATVEILICLDIALQVLHKRLDFHKISEGVEELQIMRNNWRYIQEELE